MLAPESPLRRLPGNLNPRQRAGLDGVRFAIEMAGLSYERLKSALSSISERRVQGDSSPVDISGPLVDAWSFVDSANRLRMLVGALRGVRKQEVEPLRRVLLKVKDLRDAVQHLDERLADLGTSAEPVWGALGWLSTRPGDNRVWTNMAIAGLFPPGGKVTPLNPANYPIVTPPIDHITLQAHGMSVSLTELDSAVTRFSRDLDGALVQAFTGLSSTGSDFVLMLAGVRTAEGWTMSADGHGGSRLP